jgi:hypothetical protein
VTGFETNSITDEYDGQTMAERTDADEAILDELRQGARTQAYLVDETGYSRQYIRQRLQIMEAREWVENIHEKTALWELRQDPDEDEGDEE